MSDKTLFEKLDDKWYLFVLVFLAVGIYFINKKDGVRHKEKEVITVIESEDDPRESVSMDTLYYNDTAFVVRTTIDTMYKAPANIKVLASDEPQQQGYGQ